MTFYLYYWGKEFEKNAMTNRDIQSSHTPLCGGVTYTVFAKVEL